MLPVPCSHTAHFRRVMFQSPSKPTGQPTLQPTPPQAHPPAHPSAHPPAQTRLGMPGCLAVGQFQYIVAVVTVSVQDLLGSPSNGYIQLLMTHFYRCTGTGPIGQLYVFTYQHFLVFFNVIIECLLLLSTVCRSFSLQGLVTFLPHFSKDTSCRT